MPNSRDPLRFRADVPPDSLGADQDAFGHADYAAAIAGVLAEAEAPFTFGLFGPWGVGKTTIIEEIGRRVQPQAAFAYFDAWRYEGDALRRQFLRDLAGQLHPGQANFNPDTELKDFDEVLATPQQRLRGVNSQALREATVRAALAALFLFVVLRTAGSSTLHDKHGAIRDVVVSGAVAVLLFVVTPLTGIFRVTEEIVTRSRLEDPDRFSERFSALVTSLKRPRLVIAIDNLDRCSPERVEELLSTLKTYLEPAAQSKPRKFVEALLRHEPATHDAIFLIAADDDALRRHLEAKEIRSSPTAEVGEARRYVDEYLRKFFTATVRVRPLLDQDMRSYAADQLAAFIDENKLQDDESASLIEMVGIGLSRNPRRVKQFASNLETRIRVIRERESNQRIVPTISNETLVIAKLAIIEEEWPSRYATLERDPRALDRWHQEVVEGTLAGEVNDTDFAVFQRFIRSSRDVSSRNLSSFIRLKQTSEEITLPLFGDFRELLVSASGAQIDELLQGEKDPGAYAAHLPAILDEELARGYYDGARNVVEAGAAADSFADAGQPLAQMLSRAIAHAELRRRLSQSNPSVLLRHVSLLKRDEAHRLVHEFLQALPTFARERQLDVVRAISTAMPQVDERTKQEFASALGAFNSDFELLVPPAEADGGLLPAATGAEALTAVTGNLGPDTPALAVLVAWLHARADEPEVTTGVVDLIASQVVARRGQARDEIGAVLYETLLRLAEAPRAVPRAAAEQFFAAIPYGLAEWVPGDFNDLLEIVGALGDRIPEVGEQGVARLVSEYIALDPPAAMTFAEEEGAGLAATLKAAFSSSLSPLMHGAVAELRHPAARVLESMGGEAAAAALAEGVRGAIAEHLYMTAREQILTHRSTLEDQVGTFVAEALAALPTLTGVRAQRCIALLTTFASELTVEQVTQLFANLAMFIVSGDAEKIEAARIGTEALGSDERFEGELRELANAAFSHLRGDAEPQPSLVTYVASYLERLPTLERDAFVSYLAGLLKEPTQRDALLPAVAALPPLGSRPREDLVTALIHAEIMEPDPAKRVELLRTANGAARTRGAARELLKERISALEKGTDEDRAIVTAFTGPDAQRDEPSS